MELNDKQLEALAFVKDGKSGFITGPAGTGKSFLIDAIKDYALEAEKRLVVTASTGLAARAVGGSTLHSWGSIGLGNGDVLRCHSKAMSNKSCMIKSTDMLIVDEVSMVDHEYFSKLDQVCRLIRKNKTQPFGGIQVLLFGDFFQLGPVQKGKRKTTYLFESDVWKELVQFTVVLDKSYRQTDPEYASMMNRLREGKQTSADEKRIRSLTKFEEKPPEGIEPTRLYCKNFDVDTINQQRLDALPGEPFVSDARDTGKIPKGASYRLPDKVVMKEGAQVMITMNVKDKGLYNGQRGVVTGFTESGSVKVRVDEFDEVVVGPVVEEHQNSMDDEVVASRKQLPLRLAYAITIHKSQGMSIPYLDIDLSGAFTYGQCYVALSRGMDLKKVRVRNFQIVRTSDTVKRFYDSAGGEEVERPLKRVKV